MDIIYTIYVELVKDPAGLFLILATFTLPLWFKDCRQKSTLLIFTAVILICESVSIANAFFFSTIGSNADALEFHMVACRIIRKDNFDLFWGPGFYESFLSIVYTVSSKTMLVGQGLSIFCLVLSLIVYLKIGNILGLKEYRNAALLSFGLLPTVVFLCSLTLREPYQILLFSSSIYFFMLHHIKKKWGFLILSLVLAVSMSLFSKGLILFAFFMIMMSILIRIEFDGNEFVWKSFSKWQLIFLFISLALFFLGSLIAVKYKIGGSNVVQGLINGDLLNSAVTLRNKSLETVGSARATYGIPFDTESFLSLSGSIFQMMLYFFIAPLPNQISGLKDLYAFLENSWRIVLIYFSFRFYLQTEKNRIMVGFLLILYFALSALWAMATMNYGTALRHHAVGYWIIALLGTPHLIKNLKRVSTQIRK